MTSCRTRKATGAINYTAGTGYYLVVPADLATIYNFNPAFLEREFRPGADDRGDRRHRSIHHCGLEHFSFDAGPFRLYIWILHEGPPGAPTGTNNCSDPGVNGDDAEAILDAEWASAGAPERSHRSGFVRGHNELRRLYRASKSAQRKWHAARIVSISYGESESDLGAAGNACINALYQQAVAEGVSVFVSSGDEGAASSDADLSRQHMELPSADSPPRPTTYL